MYYQLEFLHENVMYTISLGAYVPLTMNGNIVVDGVLASCYLFDHDMSHFLLTPIQWFPDFMSWSFGVDSGLQGYVTILGHMGTVVLPPYGTHKI